MTWQELVTLAFNLQYSQAIGIELSYIRLVTYILSSEHSFYAYITIAYNRESKNMF